MTPENKNRIVEILKAIQQDTEDDVNQFDGAEFNGRNVATYLGYLGAQVQALAKIMEHLVSEQKDDTVIE